MYTALRLRRGTAFEWSSKNPILAQGEQGYELDTGQFKIGDGVTPWLSLQYFIPGAGITDHINSQTPHPVYDDGPSLLLLYENAKV